ncbi:hypothetical protein HY570_03965 [Candidatus Micrarchaeota archaeon]|nr:hypothetical protein [Candidatus Micrarchaeota archaeon]
MTQKKLTPQERARIIVEQQRAKQAAGPRPIGPEEVNTLFTKRDVAEGPAVEEPEQREVGDIGQFMDILRKSGEAGKAGPKAAAEHSPPTREDQLKMKMGGFSDAELQTAARIFVDTDLDPFSILDPRNRAVIVVWKDGQLEAGLFRDSFLTSSPMRDRLLELEGRVEEMEKIIKDGGEEQSRFRSEVIPLLLSRLSNSDTGSIEKVLGAHSENIMKHNVDFANGLLDIISNRIRRIGEELIEIRKDRTREDIPDYIEAEIERFKTILHSLSTASDGTGKPLFREINELHNRLGRATFDLVLLAVDAEELEKLTVRAYAVIELYNKVQGRPVDKRVQHQDEPRDEIERALAIGSLVVVAQNSGKEIKSLNSGELASHSTLSPFEHMANAAGGLSEIDLDINIVAKLERSLQKTVEKLGTA